MMSLPIVLAPILDQRDTCKSCDEPRVPALLFCSTAPLVPFFFVALLVFFFSSTLFSLLRACAPVVLFHFCIRILQLKQDPYINFYCKQTNPPFGAYTLFNHHKHTFTICRPFEPMTGLEHTRYEESNTSKWSASSCITCYHSFTVNHGRSKLRRPSA